MTNSAKRASTKQYLNAVLILCQSQEDLDTIPDGCVRTFLKLSYVKPVCLWSNKAQFQPAIYRTSYQAPRRTKAWKSSLLHSFKVWSIGTPLSFSVYWQFVEQKCRLPELSATSVLECIVREPEFSSTLVAKLVHLLSQSYITNSDQTSDESKLSIRHLLAQVYQRQPSYISSTVDDIVESAPALKEQAEQLMLELSVVSFKASRTLYHSYLLSSRHYQIPHPTQIQPMLMQSLRRLMRKLELEQQA